MLGMPVYVLKATMPHSEFMGWLSYMRHEEPDVQEIQLAVLSTLVSSGLGNKKAKVDNFLIRKKADRHADKDSKGVSETEVRGALGMFTKKAK